VSHQVVHTRLGPRDVDARQFGRGHALYAESAYTKTMNYTGRGSSTIGCVIGPPADLLLVYIGYPRPAASAVLTSSGVTVCDCLSLAKSGDVLHPNAVFTTLLSLSQSDGCNVKGNLGFRAPRQGFIAWQKAHLLRVVQGNLEELEETLAVSHNHNSNTLKQRYGNDPGALSGDCSGPNELTNSPMLMIFNTTEDNMVCVMYVHVCKCV